MINMTPAQGKIKRSASKMAGNLSEALRQEAAAPEATTGSSLNGRVEDGATVISASFHVSAPLEELKAALSAELEALAAKVYANDGIIGHIKASTDVNHVQMYSITDTILYVKDGAVDEIDISFAFILFLIEVDTALEWTKEIMERLVEKFS